MTPTLRPFQDDLIRRLRAARAAGSRIIVAQAATGAGKTTTACEIARLTTGNGKRVLFLVHRRKLVDQISDRLRDFQLEHGVIMRGERPYTPATIQVASRDTLYSRCFRNQWIGLPLADLVIVDEGHHAAAPDSEYRDILNQYPLATIILLTATPVGPDGRGLGPWAQAIECAAPTSQLIRDGFLVPVKCYAPDRMGKKGKLRRKGVAGDLVQSWKDYAQNMPTVVFCSRISHSENACAAFNAAGISAAHIDAETPDSIRDIVFQRLGCDSLKVVCNVGIIKEGVDLPCLGCCQFYMDPGGRVAFLQGVGRIMRPFPGKTNSVLIDHAGAVFRHGFPDDDTTWTLEGNADADFKAKHDAGQTAAMLYCKACELMYHGNLQCPQCGRMPSKPPRSLFAPPPVDASDELLVEAILNGQRPAASREEMVEHWHRCLAVAKKRGGNYKMASVIFKRKYKRWPGDDFPKMPTWSRRGDTVL